MTLAKRLDDVEDHTSPPRKPSSSGCEKPTSSAPCLAYGRWLIDQPDDVYPLIRMPAQVVGAVRARNKGVPDAKLRGEFYRVQKDVLFLYHLHKQVNMRALMQEETCQLRLSLLTEKLRGIIIAPTRPTGIVWIALSSPKT